MKTFVVIGLGRFGETVARKLARLGHEVLAIDKDMDKIQHITDEVTHAVAADCKDEGVLRSLAVRNYDCAVVALAGEITDSVLISLALKELGVREVVCKAQSDAHGKILEKIGVDKVVYPEHEMGLKTAQGLSSGNLLEFIEFSDEYGIAELHVPVSWVGKSLMELDVRKKYGVTILAVTERTEKPHTDISPLPTRIFKQDDSVSVFGSYRDIEKVQGIKV